MIGSLPMFLAAIGSGRSVTNTVDSDLSTWSTTNLSVVGGQSDPDSGSSAYRMTDNGTSGLHRITSGAAAFDVSKNATVRFYAKAISGGITTLAISLNSGATICLVDLSTGAITDNGLSADLASESANDEGDGWWYFELGFTTADMTGDTWSGRIHMYDGGISYAGSSDTVDVYNFRVEQ